MDRKSQPEPVIEVRFYEGYKGRQVPRSVLVGRKEKHITEILSQKRIQDKGGSAFREVFLCQLDDGKEIEITVDAQGTWSIRF